MNKLATKENPLRVAVIGAGPSGFYASEALLRAELSVQVDLYDRLPTPYGLVRGGVAPDHPKIKSVSRLFDRTAERDEFRFFGNVCFGKDLSLADLFLCYHQILICCGCEQSRTLGIEGENLLGCHGASDFVGWYNGHPDHRWHDFPLEQVEAVAVIGNGNVALDVARILAKSTSELATTDIATHALSVLKRSRVRVIYVIGRRGPAQASFSNPELRSLAELSNADLEVDGSYTQLDAANLAGLKKEQNPRRNLEWLQQHAKKALVGHQRKVVLRFLCSPQAFLGKNQLEGIRLGHNRLATDGSGTVEALDSQEIIPLQLALMAVGYHGQPLADLPFDARSGTLPNLKGRVEQGNRPLKAVYTAGWIKRGPSGVIGTNKLDAAETVTSMLEDAQQSNCNLPSSAPDQNSPLQLLKKKNIRFITFPEWQKLNTLECQRGQPQKSREKFVSVPEMLTALNKS